MFAAKAMNTSRERGPVIVVDDDPLVLRVVTRSLENAGFRVIAKDSGFGLSAVLSSEQPTVVVLDVSMPGLDGPGVWGVARGVMAPPPSVIFYSAAEPSALHALAARYPEARSLVKPASVGEVVRAVEDAHRETERRGSSRRTPPRGI